MYFSSERKKTNKTLVLEYHCMNSKFILCGLTTLLLPYPKCMFVFVILMNIFRMFDMELMYSSQSVGLVLGYAQFCC